MNLRKDNRAVDRLNAQIAICAIARVWIGHIVKGTGPG